MTKLSDEIKALGGRYLPWTQEITLRPPDGPPKGLRLSEPCGACCLIDFFEERKSFVSDGVNSDGHQKADWFFQELVLPCAPMLEIEKVYHWATKGWSGMDGIIDPAGDGRNRHGEPGFEYQCHLEMKTTSDDGNVKPKLANREQVIRQRVVMARSYGLTDKELFPSVIFIVQKAGKRTNWIHGPFLIEPTPEELAYAQRDVDLRIQVFDDLIEDGCTDPREHPLLRSMRRGTCSRCFPLERAEADPGLDKILNGGRKDWERWIAYQKTDKWMKKIKDKVKPLVPLGQQVETEYFLIRHTESGRLYIDPRNLN